MMLIHSCIFLWNLQIVNSVVMNHVTVEDGCLIQGSVVCSNVQLQERVVLKDCQVFPPSLPFSVHVCTRSLLIFIFILTVLICLPSSRRCCLVRCSMQLQMAHYLSAQSLRSPTIFLLLILLELMFQAHKVKVAPI